MLFHSDTDALALLYLASYEGFGLPLAEAMTSGTLGVTTNASSLPEVGGPSTITTYVNDPTDPLAIADGIMEILQLKFEERKQRVQNALKWVERYGGGGQGGIGKGMDNCEFKRLRFFIIPHAYIFAGWEAMAHEIAVHIRSSKHRGSHCYNSPWTPTVV